MRAAIKPLLPLLALACGVGAKEPWPKSTGAPKLSEVDVATLPAALRPALRGFDEHLGADKIPESLRVCRIDLNRDGTNEFIVGRNGQFSCGGEAAVFALRKGSYQMIAELPGSVEFGPRVGGYLQFQCYSRIGAGHYERELLQYDRGKYRVVRDAIYGYAKDGSEILLEERRPSEADK